MDPDAVAVLVPLGFFAMIVMIVVGRPLVKAIATKAENESRRPQIPPEVTNRLERIEQAVDAIAVEVERISEAQRFTTRLLSDTRPGAALPAASPRESDKRQT